MKDYLKSSLFRQITREEAERMLECSKSQVREYTAGSVIFGEEDRSRYLYLLLDGKVQIAKHLPSGKRNLLFQIHELEVFGECFSVAGDEYCWYEAVAVKTSKVLVLPSQFVYGFCENACEHHRMLVRNLLDIEAEKQPADDKETSYYYQYHFASEDCSVADGQQPRSEAGHYGYEPGRTGRLSGSDQTIFVPNHDGASEDGTDQSDGRKVWIMDMEELGKIMEDE